MSIIQTVRDKYLWVISAAIAVSIVGFILMDSRSRGSGNTGTFNDADPIGTVNGTKITYGQYKQQSDNAEEYYKAQGRNVDEETRQQIGQQVWNQLSEMALVKGEIDKLGLALTDKQLSDEMFVNNPPQFLTQQFTDKEGHFDASAARQALNSVRKGKDEDIKNRIESALNEYVDNLLAKKYFSLMQQSAYVPKWMVQKQLADNNAISSFQYVTVPYSTIVDSTIKISDDQINDYVKKHADLYKQDEPSRSISYVSFNIQPNGTDSTNTYDNVAKLKNDFQNASDPGSYVVNNQSDQPYTNTFVSADKVTGLYKDTILKAGVGQVFGPYLENNAWTLSRIVEEKVMPDSVKARHILIGTVDPQSGQPKMDDAAAKVKIDSIYDQVKAGQDFAMLAMQYSDDEGSKIKGGDLGYFAQGTMVGPFNDSAFLGKPGEYKIVKTQFGYHLINIEDQKGMQPSYKIAYLARTIAPSQETVNDMTNKANLFAGNSRNLKQFNENAAKDKYAVLTEPTLHPMDFNLAGIGASRQLVQWVFKNDEGDVSEAFQVNGHFVVAAITSVQDAGLPLASKVRPEVEPLLRNKEKAKQIISKIGKPASLEAVATAQKQTVLQADSISFATPVIPAYGFEPKVVGFSFYKAAANKVSDPIEGTTGVYVIKPGVVAAKSGAANTEEVKSQMENQLKQSLGYYYITSSLRKAAKIKDDRSKYL